ncbi:MAG: LacI family DNA-binding transcriptional regulator [Balneolales bacterium]
MVNLTIDEVAKLAHVSRSVVSRVLNNHPGVSDSAKKRVLRVVEKYKYLPNSVARSLATKNTYEIGLFTTRRRTEELGSGFWTLIHLGIFDECIRQGYFVRLSFISPLIKSDLHKFILNAHRLDGVILLTQESTDIAMDALDEREIPTVIEGHNPKFPNVSSIDVDNFSGSYKATSYLISLGHRKIGAMFANLDMQESVERLNGYKKALNDAGIRVNKKYIAIGDYSQKFGFKTIQRWLAKGVNISAVFCASDTLAMGALLALHEAKVKVPETISIIGFDDLPISQYTIPPLTTIKQPIYGKGKRLAQLLINQIKDNKNETIHENLTPTLVIRESCSKFNA